MLYKITRNKYIIKDNQLILLMLWYIAVNTLIRFNKSCDIIAISPEYILTILFFTCFEVWRTWYLLFGSEKSRWTD